MPASKMNDNNSENCQYFEQCGGCSLQHLEQSEYRELKYSKLSNAIKRLGYDESIINPLFEVGMRGRRRVEFKVSVKKGRVSIGFCTSKTHNVVNIDDCIMTQENITKLISPLRILIESLKKPLASSPS